MRRRRAEVTALLLKSQPWLDVTAKKGSPGTGCPNPLVLQREDEHPDRPFWQVTSMPLGGPADDSISAPGPKT